MADPQPHESAAARRARLVDAAIADGRLTSSGRQRWLNLLAQNAGYEQTLATLAPGLPPEPSGQRPRSAVTPLRARPSVGRFAHPTAAAVSALARNPQQFAKAQAKAPEPTLFGGGDLPPFTASGIDPQALLQVPWPARHAAAAAATPAEAYAIVNEFTGLDGPEAESYANAVGYGGHQGNLDYVERVEQWVVAGMDEPALYASVYGDENDGRWV